MSNPFDFTGTCAKCGQLVSDGRAVHRECDVEVTEADREAAHDIAHDIYRCNDPHMNKQHSDTCDRIARAIATARIAGEARGATRENRRCAELTRDFPLFTSPREMADAIAARRAAAQPSTPTEGGK